MDSKIGRSECSRARFGVRKGWGVGAVTCILIWALTWDFRADLWRSVAYAMGFRDAEGAGKADRHLSGVAA